MGGHEPNTPGYPGTPSISWSECPIATSLRFLGRKWTLTILRDIAFFPKARFNRILNHNNGIRPRVLSLRLKELVNEGLIRRVSPAEDPRHPYYELSERGSEIWPILSALFQYGTKHHASAVFKDGRPRGLEQIYPGEAPIMMGSLLGFARGTPRAVPAARSLRPKQGASSQR